MLNADPDDSFLTYAIAKEYEKTGDIKMAISILNTLREKDPEYVGLYYHLGQLYEEMDEGEEALKVYEEGIAIAKNLKDFHALSELNGVKTNLEMEL
jgi:tetratricopeptide (TPR) repeat protein